MAWAFSFTNFFFFSLRKSLVDPIAFTSATHAPKIYKQYAGEFISFAMLSPKSFAWREYCQNLSFSSQHEEEVKSGWTMTCKTCNISSKKLQTHPLQITMGGFVLHQLKHVNETMANRPLPISWKKISSVFWDHPHKQILPSWYRRGFGSRVWSQLTNALHQGPWWIKLSREWNMEYLRFVYFSSFWSYPNAKLNTWL